MNTIIVISNKEALYSPLYKGVYAHKLKEVNDPHLRFQYQEKMSKIDTVSR